MRNTPLAPEASKASVFWKKATNAIRSLSLSSNQDQGSRKQNVDAADENLIKEYRYLQKLWESVQEDFDSRTKLISEWRENHGEQYVNDFLTWMEHQIDSSEKLYPEVSSLDFLTHLGQANWMENNDALGLVNARLWSRYISSGPDLYIGQYKDITLTLRLNGRALNPQRLEGDIYESWDIAFVNPHTLLGLQYKVLDEKAPPQKSLFVTLGK